MAEEREKKRKKAHASSTAPEPSPTRSTQDMKAGELLHHVRLEKGVELEEVSAAIHVRVAQLRAIEEGHIESLPGMTYALGFVKSYATYLKLDPISLANKFKAEHSVNPPKPDLKFPEPISEHKMPDLFMIGAGVAGVVVLLATWFFFSGGEEKTTTNVATAIPAPPKDIAPLTTSATPAAPVTPATPDTSTGGSILSPTPATTAAETATAPATTTPATTATAATTAPAAGAAAPATLGTVPALLPVNAKAAAADARQKAADERKAAALAQQQQAQQAQQQQIAAAAAAAANPQQQETINIRPSRSRVVIKATQASWVQVTDSTGKVLVKSVLRPGERYWVPDENGLSLVTSNAGGLKIYVDGQASRPIGNSGEIVRGVSLNADTLNNSPAPTTRIRAHD